MAERDVSPKGSGFSIKPRTIIIAVLVIAVLGAVMTSLYMVDQTEQAVITTFGKFSSISGPGLHVKLPFGLQKNYNVPTQVIQTMPFGFRTEQAGVETVYSGGDYPEESIMLTGDLNIIDVEWVIQYRIVDPRAWLFNVYDREKTIRDISQSVLNQLVGDRAILAVIGSERTTIAQRAQEMMNEIFGDYGLGITVTTVQLKNIVPPAGEVQDAFEDVNKAVQDMERFINEGKEAYNNEIPKAKGTAAQALQQAEGYAVERVNEAKGDVARFSAVYEQYKSSKDVTRTRLYIETMEEIFENSATTDLIDRELENFLPLKNLDAPAAVGGAQ